MDSYNYVQASPSATWNIDHGLNNFNPNIDVFVYYLGDLVKMIPLNVVSVDANNVTVSFSSTQTGQARITG